MREGHQVDAAGPTDSHRLLPVLHDLLGIRSPFLDHALSNCGAPPFLSINHRLVIKNHSTGKHLSLL